MTLEEAKARKKVLNKEYNRLREEYSEVNSVLLKDKIKKLEGKYLSNDENSKFIYIRKIYDNSFMADQILLTNREITLCSRNTLHGDILNEYTNKITKTEFYSILNRFYKTFKDKNGRIYK